MSAFHLEPKANARLDDIYDYTADRWGEQQADAYIADLFDAFARIARREVSWRALPRSSGMDGYRYRVRHHVIYWKRRADGEIAIVSILHQRMEQIARLREDLAGD